MATVQTRLDRGGIFGPSPIINEEIWQNSAQNLVETRLWHVFLISFLSSVFGTKDSESSDHNLKGNQQDFNHLYWVRTAPDFAMSISSRTQVVQWLNGHIYTKAHCHYTFKSRTDVHRQSTDVTQNSTGCVPRETMKRCCLTNVIKVALPMYKSIKRH